MYYKIEKIYSEFRDGWSFYVFSTSQNPEITPENIINWKPSGMEFETYEDAVSFFNR